MDGQLDGETIVVTGLDKPQSNQDPCIEEDKASQDEDDIQRRKSKKQKCGADIINHDKKRNTEQLYSLRGEMNQMNYWQFAKFVAGVIIVPVLQVLLVFSFPVPETTDSFEDRKAGRIGLLFAMGFIMSPTASEAVYQGLRLQSIEPMKLDVTSWEHLTFHFPMVPGFLALIIVFWGIELIPIPYSVLVLGQFNGSFQSCSIVYLYFKFVGEMPERADEIWRSFLGFILLTITNVMYIGLYLCLFLFYSLVVMRAGVAAQCAFMGFLVGVKKLIMHAQGILYDFTGMDSNQTMGLYTTLYLHNLFTCMVLGGDSASPFQLMIILIMDWFGLFSSLAGLLQNYQKVARGNQLAEDASRWDQLKHDAENYAAGFRLLLCPDREGALGKGRKMTKELVEDYTMLYEGQYILMQEAVEFIAPITYLLLVTMWYFLPNSSKVCSVGDCQGCQDWGYGHITNFGSTATMLLILIGLEILSFTAIVVFCRHHYGIHLMGGLYANFQYNWLFYAAMGGCITANFFGLLYEPFGFDPTATFAWL